MNFLIPDKEPTDVADNNVGKMTDNEIVKALECCIETSGVNCGKCPYCDNCITDENTSLMMTDTLDLINRQKAEIEMNDAEIKELRIALQGYLDDVAKTRNLYKQSIEELNQANAEIERLKKGWKADVILTANLKSEAYREFAELLFKKAERKNHKTEEYHYVLADDIVDLLKELVGEDNE